MARRCIDTAATGSGDGGGLPLALTPPLKKPVRSSRAGHLERVWGEKSPGVGVRPQILLITNPPPLSCPILTRRNGLSWRVLEKVRGVAESRSLGEEGEEAEGGDLEAGGESPAVFPPASCFFQEPVAERSPQEQPGASSRGRGEEGRAVEREGSYMRKCPGFVVRLPWAQMHSWRAPATCQAPCFPCSWHPCMILCGSSVWIPSPFYR